jgi:aminoglycoside phosphotransferase (APT) family kinase protein
VPVPEPLWFVDDRTIIGQPFMVMRRVNGTANARTLVKSAAQEPADDLVFGIGGSLAKIHALHIPQNGNAKDPVDHRLSEFRAFLDSRGIEDPVFEWTLQWLGAIRPATTEVVFCHQDFRTGNIMVQDGRVSAILDWEFAGPGDRHEDIGWFCAKCWRFGANDREAGGLGAREAFLRGYEHIAGKMIDRATLPFWEVMATLRWAIIAIAQVERFVSGRERSLELGLTAHLIPRLQADLLEMTGPEKW